MIKKIPETVFIVALTVVFQFSFPEIGHTIYNSAVKVSKQQSKKRKHIKRTSTRYASSSLLEGKTGEVLEAIKTSLIIRGLTGLVWGAEVDTTKAVIHHTESPCWTTVEDIDKWHKERGWDGIGYHYVVYCDGTIHTGRSLERQGAHAKGRNHYVGIALVGTDSFSSVQIDSLNRLLDILGIKYVEPHHEECPGHGLEIKGGKHEH